MFELSNLNDYEFEILCKDIMNKNLNIKLHTFPRGPDGGVDICDSKSNPKVVIQVKHFTKSSVSTLITELKKEIPKVSKLNPQKYYVCTSLELTRNKKNEIINLFPDYMKDISNVIDKIEIESFLNETSNQDILNKHYKLWLCSSNVISLINNQNVFIDCEMLMQDIEKYTSLFVDTQSYKEARKMLSQGNIIIIVGAPGVGKSIISKMLLLFFADKEYTIRYVTNNNISEIKKVLSQDLLKKEIILLDDFLGQHYLNLKESQPNELKSLISFVENSSNKKLIMNSRITILNEAIQSSNMFKDMMKTKEYKKYLIDLDKMPLIEKAKILYNHIYFNNLPNEYFNNLKLNMNYMRIVKHKNYNPRIIEYATEEYNYIQVVADNYYSYIMIKLNNPEDVWRDEYRNRLEEIDRILLTTLYSLTDFDVETERLEKAFNFRIRTKGNIDKSINNYKDTIIRLTESIIKNIVEKEKIKISVLNPSVNDFLKSEIEKNSSQQIEIIDNSVYFEQIFKVLKSKESIEYLINKIAETDLLKLETIKNSPYFYYLKLIIDNKVLKKEIIQNVKLSVEKACISLSFNSRSQYGELINKALNEEFYEFYDFKYIFEKEEILKNILNNMYLEDVHKIFSIYYERFWKSECNSQIVQVFEAVISDKTLEGAVQEAEDNLNYYTELILKGIDEEVIETYKRNGFDELEDIIWEEVSKNIRFFFNESNISIKDIISVNINQEEIDRRRYYFDISDSIESVLKEDYPDDYNEYDYSDLESEEKYIKEMFER